MSPLAAAAVVTTPGRAAGAGAGAVAATAARGGALGPLDAAREIAAVDDRGGSVGATVAAGSGLKQGTARPSGKGEGLADAHFKESEIHLNKNAV